mgnify:CR=1 FL=1
MVFTKNKKETGKGQERIVIGAIIRFNPLKRIIERVTGKRNHSIKKGGQENQFRLTANSDKHLYTKPSKNTIPPPKLTKLNQYQKNT